MGPGLTLQARELSMHGAAACLFSAGEKCPGPTPATRLSTLHMLQYLGGPSIIVPAWSRPIVLALAIHNWPSPPPSQALSTSVTADEPWPDPSPASPAASQPDGDQGCWTGGKTYPSPAAPPTPHEYLCVTLPQYLPFLSRPCVETCTNVYQPGNHPWQVPGISLETFWGSTLSIALAASSPCLSGTKCFMMAVASQH